MLSDAWHVPSVYVPPASLHSTVLVSRVDPGVAPVVVQAIADMATSPASDRIRSVICVICFLADEVKLLAPAVKGSKVRANAKRLVFLTAGGLLTNFWRRAAKNAGPTSRRRAPIDEPPPTPRVFRGSGAARDRSAGEARSACSDRSRAPRSA